MVNRTSLFLPTPPSGHPSQEGIGKLIRIGCIALFLWLTTVTVFAAETYQDALQAFYNQDYPGALRSVLLAEDAHPNQVELLKSLIYLKQGQADLASETFSKVNLKALNLGPYETLLTLRFTLLTPSWNKAAHLQQLKALQAHFGFNETVSRLTLEIANRLYASQNVTEAEPLYQSLSNLPDFPSISRESLRRIIDIAILQNNHPKALKTYSFLLKNYYSTVSADNALLSLNVGFNTQHLVSDFFDDQDEYIRFFRQLYDNNDYEPLKLHGQLFLNKYPNSSYKTEIQTTLAMCTFLQGQLDEAHRQFEKVIDVYPDTFWANKARFYQGRVLQKQKKFVEASDHYRNFLSSNSTSSALLPETLYYLSVNPLVTGNIPLNIQDMGTWKDKVGKSVYVDKVMWQLSWNLIEQGNGQEALFWMKRHPWQWDSDEFKARLLFWSGKLSSNNAEAASFYFNKCIERYPFTYYAYRLNQNETPHLASQLTSIFKPTGLKPDASIIRLHNLGLGEWVAHDMAYRIRHKKDTSAAFVYTLASIYSQSGLPNAAINTLIGNGISIFPKKGVSSREIATLLYPRPFWKSVQEAAKEFDMDPYLILALMREESLFNTKALSRSGALGLMQLMPFTAEGVCKSIKIPWEGNQTVLKPENNIRCGTYYLSLLKKRFNNNVSHMLSGYNAGPNITQKWVNQKQDKDLDYFVASIPYDETNGYVTRVQKSYWIYKLLYSKN
jgi:soluble lytic murein transglycosylase-like protein/outer membrane protein assembly factor BamD (BamD/ComL family)